MNELWLAIVLENGHYVGIDGKFDSKEEAIEFAESMNYVEADDTEFSNYGEFDYVSEDNSKYRLAFERIEP